MLLATSAVFTSHHFRLEKGGELETLDIAYETYGRLNEAGDNGVLVCHGYTNTPHAAGDEQGFSPQLGLNRFGCDTLVLLRRSGRVAVF